MGSLWGTHWRKQRCRCVRQHLAGYCAVFDKCLHRYIQKCTGRLAAAEGICVLDELFMIPSSLLETFTWQVLMQSCRSKFTASNLSQYVTANFTVRPDASTASTASIVACILAVALQCMCTLTAACS